MIPTFANLSDYFNNKKKRPCYKDAKTIYDSLRIHFNGEFPGDLLMARRPSEGDAIFEYRKRIYSPITKEACAPIITSLSKIKRSSDYSIKYDKATFDTGIATGESLEDYCEYKFPHQYGSVTNWIFSVLLKNILIDPNAVVFIQPLDFEVEKSDYLKPYPVIYNSDQVYEFIHEQLAVLLSIEKTEKGGNVFYVITDEVIQRWEQVNTSADYTLVSENKHGLLSMPCFRLSGVFKKSFGTDYVVESRISSIVPRLDEAAREYSDLHAEVVQHIFSERWEYATQKCNVCDGSGSTLFASTSGKAKSGVGQKLVTCQKCNGVGVTGAAPYKKTVLRMANAALGESQTPTPPAGYVEKQIDIAQLQDSRVDKHIFKALSTINMQFLAQTPLNQSGKAKEVDKDELNNFIYSIAEDVIKAEDLVYYFVNEYRYRVIVPNEAKRKKMLPSIPVPEKFDILSSSYMLDDIANGKNAGLNAVTMMAFEVDFVQKRFYDRPEARDMLQLVFDLDPLPAINEDEKLARLQGGGILELSYIISCNILPFIRQALDENEDFFDLPRKEQLAKMVEYAKPIQEANSLAEKAQLALQTAAAQKAAAAPENN